MYEALVHLVGKSGGLTHILLVKPTQCIVVPINIIPIPLQFKVTKYFWLLLLCQLYTATN